MDTTQIRGWGIDRESEDRPGIPPEQPHHVGFDTLQGQPPYSTTIPLHGLSGALRRLAYRAPDWQPRRWMLLQLADRVDVLESRLTWRNLAVFGGLAGAAGGLMALVRRRRR
jgi:hypothetical protein